MGYHIGFDVGGSKVRIVVWNQKLNVLIVKRMYTFIEGDSTCLEIQVNIIENFKKICKEFQIELDQIDGLGISLAANIDRKSGVITKWSSHKSWEGFPIYNYLKEKMHHELFIEDDANCAALGEYYFGCAKSMDQYIYITISTGVGCGIVLDGNLYTGKNGLAGELGHVKIGDSTKYCKCGERGCLQASISGTAIQKEIYRQLDKRNIKIQESLSLEEMLKGCIRNHGVIKNVFSQVVQILGNTIISLEKLFDIQDFIIGGGVTKEKDLFYTPLVEVLKGCNRSIKVHKAQLDDYNGAFGALGIIQQKNTGGLEL